MSSPVPAARLGGSPSAGPAAPGRHLPALDGLRAVAATAVLLTHVGFATGAVQPTVVGSVVARLDIGVALFFALSGFLMLRQWVRAALDDAPSVPSVRRYAVSRAARILPVYWLVTAAVLSVEAARLYGPTLQSPLRVDLREVLIHAVIGQGLSGRYFASYSQTWSLTTEITFYVAVPLLGLGLVTICRRVTSGDGRLRQARVRHIRRACAGVMVLGVAVAGYSASALPGAGGTLSTSLLGHGAWFAAGAWVYAGTQLADAGPVRGLPPERLVAVAGLLLLLAASPVGGNLLFEQPAAWQAATREGLYTVIAILVVTAASSPAATTSTVGRFLSSAPLHWLGARSYGLFLCHLPILFGVLTLLRLDLFEGSFVIVAALTFVVSAGVADLSWRHIEQPVLRRARGRHEGQ